MLSPLVLPGSKLDINGPNIKYLKYSIESIKNKTPDQIMYGLDDDGLWNGLPSITNCKIEGLELYDETGSVEEKRQYNLALLDFMNRDDDLDDNILPCEGEDN